MSSPAKLHISTLHGVFSHFLRSYGHLLGWDSQFTIITEGEAHRLAKKTLRQIIFSKKILKKTSVIQPLIEFYGFQGITVLLLRLLRMDVEFSQLSPCGKPDLKQSIDSQSQCYGRQLLELLKKMNDFSSQSWISYKTQLNEIGTSLEKGADSFKSNNRISG